jgi:serine protease Do
LVVAVVALLAAVLGAVAGVWLGAETSGDTTTTATASGTSTMGGGAGAIDVHQVLATVEPAVVTVRTQTVGVDSFLQPIAEQGTGTGVIMGANGVIVTNDHVVEGRGASRSSSPTGPRRRRPW